MNLNCPQIIRQSFAYGKKCFRSVRTCKLKPIILRKTSVECYCTQNTDLERLDYAMANNHKIDYDKITKGDSKLLKQLKYYELEINMMLEQGEKVPPSMTTEQWQKALTFLKPTERYLFYRFVWLNQIKRETGKLRKQKRHEEYMLYLENEKKMVIEGTTTSSPIQYGLSKVTLFQRIHDDAINRFYNYKLLQAMMHGPQIIIDCGYEEFMNSFELDLCTKQLMLMFSENRNHYHPSDLLFCNLDNSSPVLQKMKRMNPKIDSDTTFPFNYTEKHYLDLYSKDKLVYLTPHCNEVLHTYDSRAIVDRCHSEPFSLTRAKKDGLKVAKFPVGRYLDRRLKTMSLTINQCAAIMNDIKDGYAWPYAFKHIPKRRLKQCMPIVPEGSKFRKQN